MVSSNTYKELYEILSYMDKMTVMKIPMDILQNIKKHKNNNYKTKIDKNDIFNENNVSQETIDLLCYFYMHYWKKWNLVAIPTIIFNIKGKLDAECRKIYRNTKDLVVKNGK